jgi:alpha-mannosidase
MYYKLALAQHPMYLLIKEDTICAERTPPWGAPDIGTYIARLRQNMTTLHTYPHVKIGYEWSGMELEQLSQDAPDVFLEMLELVKAGQSTFYNGTYSQPHLQTLSSEANYRQFEWGTRVYRELCNNHQVLVYAHQESSLNEQTPQLLKTFGIRYVVLPHFSSTLNMLDGGELIFHSRFGTMFMHGEEFGSWLGLDGTLIDLYLEEPSHMHIRDWINFQEILGLNHVPPVMVEIPDLIDVDDQWISERAKADFSLLDDVLEERRKVFPPRFQLRFYTNWSYLEGIRAEELSRNDWKAEVSALRAEALNALAFMLVKRVPQSTDSAWKKILTTQHHDVYCFCAPELRAKSIQWLQEAENESAGLAEAAAQAVAARISIPATDGKPLIVFNTVLHSLESVVTAEVDVPDAMVVDSHGQVLPCETTLLPSGKVQVRFLVSLPGLGYTTLRVLTASNKLVDETLQNLFTFQNDFYQATLKPDGTFTSLVLNPSGDELLLGSMNPGNLLAARDSTGLGPTHEGTFDVSHWMKWEPSGRGSELHWQPIGKAKVSISALGTRISVAGEMGPQIKGNLLVNFYDKLSRIDLDWTFSFAQASVGHFFDDDTKLRVLWPLAFAGEIFHDISFGVVKTRDERPFLPASWVDISDGKKGLAYFHKGTIKHWVTGNTLVNLFAWGENTDAIGNRLDLVRWPKCFDQRLQGTHTIHAAIYPHNGDWRKSDVIGAACSYGTPSVAYEAQPHPGDLPTDLTLVKIADKEIIFTVVRVEDKEIICRLYSVHSEPVKIGLELKNIKFGELQTLSGEKIEEIKPYQICKLTLKI